MTLTHSRRARPSLLAAGPPAWPMVVRSNGSIGLCRLVESIDCWLELRQIQSSETAKPYKPPHIEQGQPRCTSVIQLVQEYLFFIIIVGHIPSRRPNKFWNVVTAPTLKRRTRGDDPCDCFVLRGRVYIARSRRSSFSSH